MQAADAADQISEAIEEGRSQDDRFRAGAALLIAVLAMLLAITSLGGGNVAEEMINSNIHASDTWAFYQAKNVRQTAMEIAADDLDLELRAQGGRLDPAVRAAYEQKIADYRSRAERYESEPDPEAPNDATRGEGKKDLFARAKSYEAQRTRAQDQDPNFDFADALFQIAIVLGSVAILATSRPVLGLSLVMGGLATLLMLNGFFMWFKLPF
ncbi:MAG: DUF4337 domain-containing protein [Actinomycetota bacterium]